MSCPRELQERYLGLLEGSESYRCGQTLAQMPEVKLYGLLTELTVERLERKYNDFLSLYRETGNDWNETFYVMLFRTMGAGSNREPYMKLARTVRYTDLCKVRESVASVEALLLGGAGLLQPIEFPDRYTAMLQQEFRHLSHRFEIAPLHRRNGISAVTIRITPRCCGSSSWPPCSARRSSCSPDCSAAARRNK